MRFVDLGLDDPTLREELDAAYARVIDRGLMILGAELEAFEAEFASYCGARHAVGVGNGFDALVLSLRAAGVAAGAEVIVPTHTFVATWLAVEAVGATVVPVEVSPDTYIMTPGAAAAAITSRTAAILPVSLYGHPVDIDGFMALASRHGLFVLEDAAQSHGASYRGRRTGRGAHATAFSFYPTKNLGALGDGGAITTSDPELAARLMRLRNYGSSRKYVHEETGVNSRLDEMQAAFLRVFLPRLDSRNDARRGIALAYADGLAGVTGLTLPRELSDARHVYHLYVVRTARRQALQASLTEAGVQTQVHYPVACHLQPAFAARGFRRGEFPLAEQLADEVLSLPMWPGLRQVDIASVAQAVRAVV
ncbi:MAG: DegT/DnrJ/EryC1/StrS family aminotransferase [Phenylobacterium sp.]|nr:DegT/DnrJ/EryC1/StrS family aminotransferase [Phenylobacterium sp.]